MDTELKAKFEVGDTLTFYYDSGDLYITKLLTWEDFEKEHPNIEYYPTTELPCCAYYSTSHFETNKEKILRYDKNMLVNQEIKLIGILYGQSIA